MFSLKFILFNSSYYRYGPYTDWMASMDPDEYFIPMGNYSSWKQILDKVDRDEGRSVLKFRSTRARPLLSTLEWVDCCITYHWEYVSNNSVLFLRAGQSLMKEWTNALKKWVKLTTSVSQRKQRTHILRPTIVNTSNLQNQSALREPW